MSGIEKLQIKVNNNIASKKYVIIGHYEEWYVTIGDVVYFIDTGRLYFIQKADYWEAKSSVHVIPIPLNIEEFSQIYTKKTRIVPIDRLIFINKPCKFLNTNEYVVWLMKCMHDMCMGKIPIPRKCKDLSIAGDSEEQIKEYINRPLFPGWKFSPNKYDSYIDYKPFADKIPKVLSNEQIEAILKEIEAITKEIIGREK